MHADWDRSVYVSLIKSKIHIISHSHNFATSYATSTYIFEISGQYIDVCFDIILGRGSK